ncbi:galactose oxidase [Fistulina hepatica ATCC 64428]|uniref:Galactose oxidase n=1 Tax=Fistulina hepatica ATCC 64428 TaxID=1128425 RepID=A0A0D7AC15_9AGAR|nr:galactose oxidase [Fistulina hepatica ATCC 64428]
MSVRGLNSVPEEGVSPTPTLRVSHTATTSTSTSSAPSASNGVRSSSNSRKSSSSRSGRSTGDAKRSAAPSATAATRGPTANKENKPHRTGSSSTVHKVRSVPRFHLEEDVEPVASTLMYWSRAPMWGHLPIRTMRAHSVTLVDSTAWMFGGCDDRESTSKEVYCFDTDTMQWTHPDVTGDIPPPSRAHTATLVDRKIVVFGGGQNSTYFNSVHILDTLTRRWTKPVPHNPNAIAPAPRRAHTAVYYRGKIWIFGGGNGMTALNDVWTLDVSVPGKFRWELVETKGRKPTCRGYHTANLVGNLMIIIGGSDGNTCFSDLWYLDLETLEWNENIIAKPAKRLSHTSTQVGSYLFLIAGHDGTDYRSDILFMNLVGLQYEERQVAGKPPCGRGYHATVLVDSRLFVFGGYNGGNPFDDVYVLDLAASAYLPQVTSFTVGALDAE